MNRKKMFYTGIAVIITVPLLVVFYIKSFTQSNEIINCKSAFSIVSGPDRLSFSVTFFIRDGSGLFTFSGNSGSNEDDMILRKYFSYTKKSRDIYVLKGLDSEVRIKPGAQTEHFTQFFPFFFTNVNEGSDFILKVIQIKEQAWLLMSTNTPYFLCEQN